MEVVVVANSVGLDARQKVLVESRRLGLAAEQKFIGAVDILHPSPNTLVAGKAQGGFGQVAVEVLAAQENVIASPKQCRSPIASMERTVIHDRSRHALHVVQGMQL